MLTLLQNVANFCRKRFDVWGDLAWITLKLTPHKGSGSASDTQELDHWMTVMGVCWLSEPPAVILKLSTWLGQAIDALNGHKGRLKQMNANLPAKWQASSKRKAADKQQIAVELRPVNR